jgi:hypothetical protein
MSLSLYGVPDGQEKGQSLWPCPSVHSPASALGSLSSVALSSAPASATLTYVSITGRNTTTQTNKSCGSFHDAAILISRTFLNEATGRARKLLESFLSGDKNAALLAPTSKRKATPLKCLASKLSIPEKEISKGHEFRVKYYFRKPTCCEHPATTLRVRPKCWGSLRRTSASRVCPN